MESITTPGLWIDDNDNQCFECTPVPAVDYKYQKIVSDSIVKMSQAEQDAVDAVELTDAKTGKNGEIDNKTGLLILNGFQYQDDYPNVGDSGTYSLSMQSQINITNVKLIKDNPAIYPLKFMRKDNVGFAILNNASDVDDYYGDALTEVRSHLDSGSVLKTEVLNATTIAEVDAVDDDR